jgi:hypothetical protein
MRHVTQLVIGELDEGRLPRECRAALRGVAVDRVGDDERGRVSGIVPAVSHNKPWVVQQSASNTSEVG